MPTRFRDMPPPIDPPAGRELALPEITPNRLASANPCCLTEADWKKPRPDDWGVVRTEA